MPTVMKPSRLLLPDNRRVGTGWLPPLEDPRDYSSEHPAIKAMLATLQKRKGESTKAAYVDTCRFDLSA